MLGYRTKTELAYVRLREDLAAGVYPPGTRLIVDQVAARLGTSKVPVREAVVRLAGEGWLVIKPHVGAVVPDLDPKEILETSVIRAAVEGAAIRHTVASLRPETLARLRSLLDDLDAAAAHQMTAYPALNYEFHSVAIDDCRYDALKALARSYAEKSFRLRTVQFLPQYLPESQAQHRSLVAAMERGDADAAERIVRDHIERAGQLLWHYALTRQPVRQDDESPAEPAD